MSALFTCIHLLAYICLHTFACIYLLVYICLLTFTPSNASYLMQLTPNSFKPVDCLSLFPSICPDSILCHILVEQRSSTLYIPHVSIEIVISVQYPLFIVASSVLLHNAESSNLVVTSPHKSLVLIKLIVESLVVQNLAYYSSSYIPKPSSS